MLPRSPAPFTLLSGPKDADLELAQLGLSWLQ